MKGTFRLVGAAVVACSLVSCASGGRSSGGLIDGTFGTAGRLIQAMGRSLGLSADASKPDDETGSPVNVEARGRLIETQGAYGSPVEQKPKTKMASAH